MIIAQIDVFAPYGRILPLHKEKNRHSTIGRAQKKVDIFDGFRYYASNHG